MKNALHLLLTVCVFMLAAGPSVAGLAHVGDSLACADCHTMHYSMQHNYSGGSTGLVVDPTGPFKGLLKASPNNLCLACHNGTGSAPDVLENPGSYVRQAGALNRVVGSSSYPIWTGHTLDSKDTAPGGTWSNQERGLLCIDCHAQHGIETQFRNLWASTTPGDKFENKTLTFETGNPSTNSKDVWLHDGFGVATRYGIAGTDFNEPDPTKSRYAEWCMSCHTNFHGAGGSANMGGASGGNTGLNPWKRHPAADVNIGANGDEESSINTYNPPSQPNRNKVKVMSASRSWNTPGATDLTPSCFSCHKAHGNKNAFGLIYMSGTGTVTEQGDSGGANLQALCRQCHTQ